MPSWFRRDGAAVPWRDIYGDGTAGLKIAEILAGLGHVEVQKRITY